MEWFQWPMVVAAGLVCGFINTLAGSGSLITLPLLIFIGLPANVANGTNRVAILLQNVVAVRGFHKQGVLDWRGGRWLLLPALLGAVLGARLAVTLDERAMRLAIAVVMLAMLAVLLIKPNRWLKGGEQSLPAWLGWLIFFVVGIYGGFIQAGVGIFLLAALVLAAGYDLIRANALKVLVVLGFTPLALAIFVLEDMVAWGVGLVLALGNMTGAWLGTKAAVKGGAPFIRWLLIVVVAVSAIKLLWDAFA